ncbi:Calpain-14 [Manis javanica]|nr:Calpain-14 [Manis javanica]
MTWLTSRHPPTNCLLVTSYTFLGEPAVLATHLEAPRRQEVPGALQCAGVPAPEAQAQALQPEASLAIGFYLLGMSKYPEINAVQLQKFLNHMTWPIPGGAQPLFSLDTCGRIRARLDVSFQVCVRMPAAGGDLGSEPGCVGFGPSPSTHWVCGPRQATQPPCASKAHGQHGDTSFIAYPEHPGFQGPVEAVDALSGGVP